MEERPDRPEDEEGPQQTPMPPDAPVETPQADPRTEQSPDPGEARPVGPAGSDTPDATEEQIKEAFE